MGRNIFSFSSFLPMFHVEHVQTAGEHVQLLVEGYEKICFLHTTHLIYDLHRWL